MKYQNWNSSTAKRQSDYLSKLDSTSCNQEKILLDKISLETISPYDQTSNFKDFITEDIDTHKIFLPFYDDVSNFAFLRSVMRIKEPIPLSIIDITSSDLLAFVHDFYASLDKDFYKVFKRIFKERKNNLKFSDNRSMEYYFPSLNYSYLNIKKEDTINDFINIAHEYMHAICDHTKWRENSRYPFEEVAPLFIELITYDFILDAFELSIDDENIIATDITSSKALTALSILKYAKYNVIEASYLSQLDRIKRKRDTIKEISKFTNTKKKTVFDIMNSTSLERYTYTIAYLVAIELYNIYLIEPDYALNILKRIITLEESNNYYLELEKLGIHLNEHSKEYIKTIRY